MPDIAEQLDAAIGTPPTAAPPLDRALAEGRRALARRRLAVVAGAAATAVVVGGTAWAVSPGDGGPHRSDPGFGAPSDPGSVATPPSVSAPPPTNGLPQPPSWPGPDAALIDRRGDLQVEPGWTVTRRVDDVNGPGTLGIEVRKGDRRQWFLFGPAMTIATLHAPSEGYATFQEWVDVNGPLLEARPGDDDTAADPGDWPGEPRDDLVRFVPRAVSLNRGLVPASADVTILDQVYDPDLGASFAPPGRSGAAEVRKGDETFYVVARRPDDYIAVRADVAERRYGVTDLASFLDLARERYAEGGGGLL